MPRCVQSISLLLPDIIYTSAFRKAWSLCDTQLIFNAGFTASSCFFASYPCLEVGLSKERGCGHFWGVWKLVLFYPQLPFSLEANSSALLLCSLIAVFTTATLLGCEGDAEHIATANFKREFAHCFKHPASSWSCFGADFKLPLQPHLPLFVTKSLAKQIPGLSQFAVGICSSITAP